MIARALGFIVLARSAWAQAPLAPEAPRAAGPSEVLQTSAAPLVSLSDIGFDDLGTAVAAVYLLAAALVSRALIVRESRLGRFVEAPSSRSSRELSRDERRRAEREHRSTCIAEHLAGMEAEVAGTIFHGQVGTAEAAALLARLEAEGTIVCVGGARGRAAERQLVRARDTLADHERALVDAIFFDGPTTSMAAISNRHRTRGFSPADVLRAPLEQRVRRIHGVAPRERQPGFHLAFSAFLAVCILNFALFAFSVEEHDAAWFGGATALTSLACMPDRTAAGARLPR